MSFLYQLAFVCLLVCCTLCNFCDIYRLGEEITQVLRHLDVFDAIYLPGVHRGTIDGAVRLKLV